MALADDIDDIRARIKSGQFTNEASVSQGIVLRLLHALQWPQYNTQVVCPEYPLEGSLRVDFALCHPPGKPIGFIEVKKIGQSDGAERQLFEYAFHKGVPLAILTDGREWNFFLPGEQGDYGERRVYKLDLLERDTSECVTRLERYLGYAAIASGAAMNAAREDYTSVARERQIKGALPVAWERLVNEEDELLLEVVADSAQTICGFKPDPDVVASFLRELAFVPLRKAIKQPSPARDAMVGPNHTSRFESNTVAQKVQPVVAPRSSGLGFTLDGTFYPGRNAKDVMLRMFEALSAKDATFLERFAALPHGRRRRYLARNRDELYPGRPDLCVEYATRLGSGWWVSTNHSKKTIKNIVDLAREVAGKYSDLVADFGE